MIDNNSYRYDHKNGLIFHTALLMGGYDHRVSSVATRLANFDFRKARGSPGGRLLQW